MGQNIKNPQMLYEGAPFNQHNVQMLLRLTSIRNVMN